MTIKQYRLAYGIKQSEVAELLGISVKQYSFKENGKYKFNIDEVRKIFKLFSKYNKLDAGKFFLEA